MYGIYFIYNNNELIYVGKTNNFYIRLKNHVSSKHWGKDVTHIEVGECNTKIDMDIYEKYYINKLKPKYNKADVYNEPPTFKIEELKFKKYKIEEFLEKNKYKDNGQTENKSNINIRRLNEVKEMLQQSVEIKKGEKINLLNLDSTLYHWYDDDYKNKITFLRIKSSELFKICLSYIKNKKYKLENEEYCFRFKNRKDIFDEYSEKHTSGLEIICYSLIEGRVREENWKCVNIISRVQLSTKTDDVTLFIAKDLLEKEFYKYFKYL